jgi:hypothetical protein
LFLDFEELRAGLCELAAEAVAVEAEVGQGSHEDVPGFDQGDSVPDFFQVFGEAQEIRFHGSDAVDAPGELGEGADEVEFADRVGVVVVEEGLEVDLVEFVVLAGDDGELAGESVAEGVQRRFLFAFRRARTGGFLGVQAVDFGTSQTILSPVRGYGRTEELCGE